MSNRTNVSILRLTAGSIGQIKFEESRWTQTHTHLNGGCTDGSAQLHMQTIWTHSEAMEHTNGKLRRRIYSSFFCPLPAHLSIIQLNGIFLICCACIYIFCKSFEFRTQSMWIKIKYVCVCVWYVCEALLFFRLRNMARNIIRVNAMKTYLYILFYAMR